MITRRTFASRAALFVLGCALQVSGAAALLKRKAISRIEEVRIGMVFKNPVTSKRWQVLDVQRTAEDPYGYTRRLICYCPGHKLSCKLQEIDKYDDWRSLDQSRPLSAVLCSSGLDTLEFHFPV